MTTVSPPQLITPPSGLCDVLAFNAETNTVELLGSFEDATRAHTTMRKRGGGSACLARGGVVCSFLSSTPLSHHPRIKAAVALEWARRTPQPSASTADRTHAIAPTGAVVEADDTERLTDVEPAAAPSPTTDHDEDTVTAKTANNCTRCSKYPIAGITATTRPDETTWCAHCRRTSSMRLAGTTSARKPKVAEGAAPRAVTSKTTRTAAKAVKPARATKPTVPDQAPVVLRLAAVPTNTAVLDRVSRALVVVEQLGGIEKAEAIAAAHALPVGP